MRGPQADGERNCADPRAEMTCTAGVEHPHLEAQGVAEHEDLHSARQLRPPARRAVRPPRSAPTEAQRKPGEQQERRRRQATQRADHVPRRARLQLRSQPAVGRMHPEHQQHRQTAQDVDEFRVAWRVACWLTPGSLFASDPRPLPAVAEIYRSGAALARARAMFKSISIFSGSANRPLAEATAGSIGLPLGRAELHRFSDGETFCVIQENVRGVDTYVVQPTCSPGERQRDGAADHGRRAPPRLGRLDHRGHPVLRLRAAGSQGRAADADHVEARRRPHRRRRRQPRRRDRPARRADPGLLQHPVRSPLSRCRALLDDHLRETTGEALRVRLPGCRRRRARARVLEAPRRRRSPSSTSAASGPTRARSCTSSAR